MRQLHRRGLIGVFFALSNIIHWRWELRHISTWPSASTPANESKASPRRQRKVFNFQEVLLLQGTSSARLIPAAPGEEHLPDAIWSTRFMAAEKLLPLAIESMHIRQRRRGRIKEGGHLDAEGMKSDLLNFTQEELNAVDPMWQIFVLDMTDGGHGIWPYWYMQNEMAAVLGHGRINYATRSTQNSRAMDQWVGRMNGDGDLKLAFEGFYGKPVNFTETQVDGVKGSFLKKGARSVQRLFMTVREDIVKAIDEYVMENHPPLYEEATRGASRDETSLRLSPAVAGLSRPTDVRTFWNASVCNMHCSFRNYIAETVASLPLRHPAVNIQTNTDVIGFIHNKGRNAVHPDFVRAMLSTKIIVLAQRDPWEGHSRLYEALLSGALVMSDPQVYWPHGTKDGENIVVYHGWADLELKILHYLDPKNKEERVTIGRRGRETALTFHRSWQQAERLFLNDMTYRNNYGLSNKPW